MRGFSGLLSGTALAAFAGVLGASPAAAQAELQYAEADTVTVTATRTEADAFDVPSVVTVITEEEIENNLVGDIKDLVRFEPGVSVRRSPARFSAAFASTGRDGNSGFNIRGLEGDRVLIQVDGVRVPDGFSFGPALFGRGDYVDLGLLSSVEIVRGPASALYGSDGLAGVVSFTTMDPDGFLREGEDFGARLRAAYSGDDDAWDAGFSVGGRWGDWSGLLAYTRHDGHEYENQGDNDAPNATRTAANPQDVESNSALGRLVFQPSDQHRFRLTLDYSDRNIVTEALTSRAPVPAAPTDVIDLDGLDESERARVSFDHRYEKEGGLIDRASWSVYYQDSSLVQFSDEDRLSAADRIRETRFENQVWGAAAQAERSFATGAIQHRLVFGGDYSQTRQEGLRDGTVPSIGDFFPSRPFPNTDYTLAGLFVQDEISVADGRITFFPALRYDSYDLEPEADALYPAAVASQSDARITPRFGVVTWPTDDFGVFFNYAQGFKAPTPSQVNNNFSNPIFGYTSLPNPDLGPEESESLELGVRFRGDNLAGAEWRASATAFGGWYDDFIEQAVVGGSFTPMDPAIFQFVNLGEVEISGFEARADLRWANGFGLRLAGSYAEGNDVTGGVATPLDSIDPLKLVGGLSYDDPGGRFGGQLILTYSAQKDEDDACAGCFRPDAFTLVDITGYWNVTEAATLRVGVFNVTDEHYWWWSDVRGVSETSTVLDAYTQPGANFSASISYRF